MRVVVLHLASLEIELEEQQPHTSTKQRLNIRTQDAMILFAERSYKGDGGLIGLVRKIERETETLNEICSIMVIVISNSQSINRFFILHMLHPTPGKLPRSLQPRTPPLHPPR